MSDYAILISIVLLRVIIGLRFVFPGWMLILMGPLSAREYLQGVEGPFAPLFKKMAKSKIVDYVNKWGLFLIGLAIVFGVFVGLACLLGILLMFSYWFSKWSWKEGIIDERIVNIAVLIFLLLVQAGLFFGFDYFVLQIPMVSEAFFKYAWLRWIL